MGLLRYGKGCKGTQKREVVQQLPFLLADSVVKTKPARLGLL
jgi:hypothetical protein